MGDGEKMETIFEVGEWVRCKNTIMNKRDGIAMKKGQIKAVGSAGIINIAIEGKEWSLLSTNFMKCQKKGTTETKIKPQPQKKPELKVIDETSEQAKRIQEAVAQYPKDIKTDFVDENNYQNKIINGIALKHNIGIRGKTGTGKTFCVSALHKGLKAVMPSIAEKAVTLNMTTHTTIDETKGKYTVKPKPDGTTEIAWVNGIVTDAMLNGYWLVVEEANFMNEELASVFYSVMDDRKQIILDEKEKEVINAHPNFRLFLTMNWDYKGTQRPNPAIINRISNWQEFEYLKPKAEAKLLHDRTGITSEVAEKLISFANKVREQTETENWIDLSTRTLLRWAELIVCGETIFEAAEQTIIPTLAYENAEKQKLRDLLKLEFGEA